MSRTEWTVLAIMFVALLLTGCGGGGGSTGNGTTVITESTECHNDTATGARVCTETK